MKYILLANVSKKKRREIFAVTSHISFGFEIFQLSLVIKNH